MIDRTCTKAWNSQQGRITVFGVIILVMLLITAYELNIIYADWNKIRLISLNINVLNDLRTPVAGVGFTIDDNYIGQTNTQGKITALISKPGRVKIIARKKPFEDIDTTIALDEDGSNVVFTMNRPYATLTVVAVDEEGKPLKEVGIVVDDENQGRTGENGSITISESVHILDSVDVKLSKSGYEDLSKGIYLAEAGVIDSLTMVKRTTPSRPAAPPPKPKPKPDFQTYVNRASNYLDRAISGESKYFGRALTEIDKAIKAKPRSIPAKQLKVEILFNFAKSLRDSNLPYEAVNRLGEALKMYRDIPQDPLYSEVVKLKSEIERELGQ